MLKDSVTIDKDRLQATATVFTRKVEWWRSSISKKRSGPSPKLHQRAEMKVLSDTVNNMPIRDSEVGRVVTE